MTREDVYKYAEERYEAKPEYPWMRSPKYAVLRHKNSRKWFAAIVDITEDKLGLPGTNLIDALLLKCDPIFKGSLIDHQVIFPAYHMNKEHWITVMLGNFCHENQVCDLIDHSYELTKGETK